MKQSEISQSLKSLARQINIEGAPAILHEAANLIQSLTPRPIEEAPRDEWLLAECINERYKGRYFIVRYIMLNDYEDWQIFPGCGGGRNWFKSFIPLSAIQALMESGK